MDLRAYHNALNQGFSESEASRIGDDAWENNRHQPTCDPEPEPDYYDVLVAENTRLLATIERLRKLGARLAELLDEDQFAECEALLLAAGVMPEEKDNVAKA